MKLNIYNFMMFLAFLQTCSLPLLVRDSVYTGLNLLLILNWPINLKCSLSLGNGT